MKEGMDIVALAQEIKRREAAKQDYTAPTTELSVGRLQEAGDDLQMQVGQKGCFGINEVAHQQLGDHLGIPRRYYTRMQAEAPDLLAANINTWLIKKPSNRMIRTLDGRVRAFLSDRYQCLDNEMVAQAALPVLLNQEAFTIKSCTLTETRLYIQALSPRLMGEVKVGEVVQGGIVLSNSEVGLGAVMVEPLIFKLACTNGMIRSSALKRHHVGRRIEQGGEAQEFYATETIKADINAFMLKIRDTVAHAFDELAFHKELELFRLAAEQKIPAGNIQATVEEVTKRFDCSKGESDNILTRLIEGGDLSQWGLANAVTNLANDVESYDRAVELERKGGQIIDLSPREWQVLSKAA